MVDKKRVEKMRVLLPPKYLCKKMSKLLQEFYDNEKDNTGVIKIDNYKIFKEAVKIFCDWYELEYPITHFKRVIDKTHSLGECTENGIINLLYPNIFYIRKQKQKLSCNYISLVYHELGHYYLWSNPETKALEFELKMTKRGR